MLCLFVSGGCPFIRAPDFWKFPYPRSLRSKYRHVGRAVGR